MSAVGTLKSWEALMLALLVAIIAFNSVGSPYFLSVGNFVNLFQLSIEKSIVALTMALVIIGGEIDLSVASVMGLAACVMAWTFSTTPFGSQGSACHRLRSRLQALSAIGASRASCWKTARSAAFPIGSTQSGNKR
jgi:ribose/xylose/arabinose/galactoside ABC-type transport system permease subunit